MEIIVIMAIVIGLYMAWNIGANDVANSMANAVGSKSLTLFWAVVLAAICEFCGAVLVGSHVADTIRKGIIDPNTFAQDPMILAHGMICAMLGAAIWLNGASYFGMPVSTTHSIVGAILGFGIIEAGFGNVNWPTLGKVVSSWFISPVAGGVIAFILFKLISKYILNSDHPDKATRRGIPVCVFFTFMILILATIYKGLKHLHLTLTGPQSLVLSMAGALVLAFISYLLIRRVHNRDDGLDFEARLARVEKMFIPLVIVSSCTVAFAHGANDVANAIGPLAVVLEIVRHNVLPDKVMVAPWVLCLGGSGIVLGLATFGYRVMMKVGLDVTEITPSRGAAADIATMMTVLVCSRMGLPISTTHTLVGSILGVGMARGITAINRKVVGSIFTSWLITVPIAAVLTVVFYIVGNWLFWA